MPEENERRKGEGQTTQGVMGWSSWSCAQSSMLLHALMIHHTGPPHIDQSKKIKSSQRAKPSCRPRTEPGGCKEPFLPLAWWPTILDTLLTSLHGCKNSCERATGVYPPFPGSYFSRKPKVFQSNKMSAFLQAVLKCAYEQHCRKVGKNMYVQIAGFTVLWGDYRKIYLILFFFCEKRGEENRWY